MALGTIRLQRLLEAMHVVEHGGDPALGGSVIAHAVMADRPRPA
jgi:hypothetical protein